MKMIMVLTATMIAFFSQCSLFNSQDEKMKNQNIRQTDFIEQKHPLVAEAMREKDLMHFYSSDSILVVTQKVIQSYEVVIGHHLDQNSEAVYIFRYNSLTPLSKEDFKNNTFYEKLCPYKNNAKAKFSKNEMFIEQIILKDKDNNAIATGDFFSIYPSNKKVSESLRYYQLMLDKKKELNIVYFFTLGPISTPTPTFGLTSDSTIYVFQQPRGEPTVKSLDDFFNTQSNEFFENKYDIGN